MKLVKTPHNCELHIDSIKVGIRHRVDVGDVAALADSIKARGLIHNVVVTPEHTLVAGFRRLEAMKLLGRELIPVSVIRTLADATDLLLAERDENTCRKDFTKSELISLGRALEELERPRGKERMGDGGGDRKSEQYRVTSNDATRSKGKSLHHRTNHIVGNALGISQTKYERLKIVDNATRDPDERIAVAAREQLALLDSGKTTIGGATDAIRNLRNNPAPKPVVDLPSKPKSGPRPNHLKILTNIVNTMDGFDMVLDDIREINSTINEVEARRLTSGLDRQLRSLNRIRKLLRGIYT